MYVPFFFFFFTYGSFKLHTKKKMIYVARSFVRAYLIRNASRLMKTKHLRLRIFQHIFIDSNRNLYNTLF